MTRAGTLAASLVAASLVACSGGLVVDPASDAAAGGGGAGSAAEGAESGGPADCDVSHADCDGDGSCETTLGTPLDCGGCGEACVTRGGEASCVDGACVATCDGGFADCNASGDDGCEVTLANDRDHCGSCDAHCDSGEDCFAGTCLHLLAIAQAALVGAESLVLHDGNLDWATPGIDLHGQIARVGIDGGPTTALVTGLGFPTALHRGGGYLVWCDALDPSIRRMALPVGPAEDVLIGVGGSYVLDVDDVDIYFTTGTDLQRLPIAGGAPTVLASGLTAVAAGELEDGTLYFSDRGPEVLTEVEGTTIVTHPQGMVARWSSDTGVTVLAIDLDAPGDVRVSGDALYWLESGSRATYWVESVPKNLGLLGRISRADRDGGGRTTLADNLVSPIAIAVDATHVYWAEEGTVGGVHPEQLQYEGDGSLSRVAVAGGAPEVLVPAIDARDVVLDEDAAYFSSWYYGFVARIEKP